MSASTDSSPRVALVHDWLTGMRGGEKVLEQMAALFPEAPIFTLFHFPGSVSKEIEAHPIHTSFVQRLPALQTRYRHYLPLFPRAIESFDLSDFDLVLSTSHCVAKSVPFSQNATHLCYCHTPMRYVWDQQRVYFPKSNHPVALIRDGLLARLRAWDRRTANRPSMYIANSHFVKDRIERYYGRESTVVAPPVDVEFFHPEPHFDSAQNERTHLLYVAALNAYKKVDVAIDAAAELALPLVVVGYGPDRNLLKARAQERGASVSFRSGISPVELRQLYRQAIAYIQPALEDFGIASVEALACGTPVAAMGQGGILDIVESDQDGILYEPAEGLEGLVRAVRQVAAGSFDEQALALRAQRFSAIAFADRFAKLIESVDSGRSRQTVV